MQVVQGYRPYSDAGISGIELLVAVSIFLTLSLLSYSKFPDLILTYERNQSLQEFQFALKRARNEAVAEGTRVILTMSVDQKSYTVGYDHLPFSSPAVADQVIYTRELPESMSASIVTPIVFDGRGYLIDDDGNYTSNYIIVYQEGSYLGTVTIYPTGAIGLGGT